MLKTILMFFGCFLLGSIVTYLFAGVISTAKAKRRRRKAIEEMRAKAERAERAERAESKMPEEEKKKKTAFSKIMLIVFAFMSVLLTAACAYVKVRFNMDVTDLVTLAAASYTLDGTWGGFYLWKSKNENRAKYAQQFVIQFADKYGVDAAIRIAEVVLRD